MKDDRSYCFHIKDAIERVQLYTVDGRAAFLSDRKTQDAVLRNLEIIGEAVKQISPEIKSQYSQTRWREISGMRDKLIHEYFGVNLDIVWEVVGQDLPDLKNTVDSILERLGPSG